MSDECPLSDQELAPISMESPSLVQVLADRALYARKRGLRYECRVAGAR